jgi:regulatory protein
MRAGTRGSGGGTLPEKPKKSPMDAALGYLTARMRSECEVRSYLLRKGYAGDECEQTITRLTELSLIDDKQFSTLVVQNKTAQRPIGRRALAYELRQKSISGELIEKGLEEYTRQDEQEACAALFAKLAQKHGTDRQGFAKIQRALSSRGFDFELIRQASQRYDKGDDWQ